MTPRTRKASITAAHSMADPRAIAKWRALSASVARPAARLRIVDVGVDVGVIVDDLVGVVVDVDLDVDGRFLSDRHWP